MKTTKAQHKMLVEMRLKNNKITIVDQRRMRTLRSLQEMDMVSLRAFHVDGKMGFKAEITNIGLNTIL